MNSASGGNTNYDEEDNNRDSKVPGNTIPMQEIPNTSVVVKDGEDKLPDPSMVSILLHQSLGLT